MADRRPALFAVLGSLLVLGGGASIAGSGQVVQEVDQKCEDLDVQGSVADACRFGLWPGAVPGAATGWITSKVVEASASGGPSDAVTSATSNVQWYRLA